MYRDDDTARTERATDLIAEIADLERQKLAHARAEQRLEAARAELAALQVTPPAVPAAQPGAAVHLAVFGATAVATYLGYTLLLMP